MTLIRIFDSREEAEKAKKILKEGGIEALISEDKFEGVPIQKFNVPARFRLLVDDRDFYKAARFLAGKLKKTKN